MKRHKGLRLGASGFALVTALVMAGPVVAAESDATLTGNAPAGTVITATDTNTGASSTATAGSNGRYVLVGLRPSNYTVTFKLPDGTTRTDSAVLPVGQTIELNAQGDAASNTETGVVTVRGRRNSPRNSEVSTSVSRQQMESLPQNGRNFLNFAALAPGVSVSTDPERKTFQAGAVNANQVNVFIDGQSQKNQILQGGVSGQDSSRGNPFPQLAVQEFKVSTQNFKAEYEQAGSAIITAITKTGGTEFHGTVFGTLQTKDMIGQPYYVTGDKPDYENTEYGFDIGGPILKNKLHFYASYEGRKDKRPTDSVNMQQNTAFNTANPTLTAALANAYNGAFAKDFQQDMVFGKLTWFADDDNTIDLTVKHRKEDDLRGFGGTTAYERGSTLDQEIKGVGVKWRHRAGNLLNDMQLSYEDSQWRQSSLSTSPAITIIGRDAPTGGGAPDTGTPNINTVFATFGGASYSQNKGQESLTLRNDVTLIGTEWHGTHVIKGGFKLANYKYTADENDRASNPEFFYVANGTNAYVYGASNNVPYAVKIADGNPRITSTNMQFGVYLQDDWTIDEHWTINLGVRWDYESNMLNDDFVTPADIAAAMRSTAGFNVAFNPDDYISTGDNRDSFMGGIAPRLGFSYDVNGDRDLVIFGGYGRYYDRTIYDLAQLETRRAQIHVAQINFTPGGDTDTDPKTATWNPSYFGNPDALVALAKANNLKGEVFALSNETKVPYSDQFNVGVRKRLGDINTSATLSYIKYSDLFNWVLGNRRPDGTWCQYGPQYACQPWGNGLNGGYGNLIISTNDREARYKAIYLSADKPWTRESKYGFTATLTLADAEMTGHNDPFIFDYANPRDTGWHHAEGVDKWRFVGSGIVSGPWDTRVSTIVTLASGTPFQSIDNTGPALRIIDGYYFPKKGFSQVDLRLSKDFTLPNGQMVTVDGQIYNLFDTVNRKYSGWTGGFNGGSGASLEPDANAQEGPSRSFQVGLTYKW